MKFGRIRDLLLTLLLILSVDGCNSDKKDVNAEGANSTSNLSKDGDIPIRNAGDKHTIPSGMTIPTKKISSYIVSLSDGTTDVQGEINEWGIEVKIPCNITETNSPVKLHAYSRTFTIASSSTENNESGIVATFAWTAQELNSSTKSFDAYITIDDSKGNYDGLYEAKKLAIDNKSGITAATFSYPRGDATIDGTLSLKIVPGILDRNFYKKTNGKFEHRFIYAPVTNPVTGRTWLNNNLGAEYANLNSKYFNPSQQATTSSNFRAYGSLFEWGRKADGHELIKWSDSTHGEPLYGKTTTKADDPSNSLYIINSDDWRVHSDDTLWASESTPNNVCPVGYRLPLNPSGVSDGENEWFVEMSTWDAPDAKGSISSYLKLPYAGHRKIDSGDMVDAKIYGEYWTGSYFAHKALNMHFGEKVEYNNRSEKSYGYSVRCIKDQTPAERSATILLEIANEDRNHKSVITAAQLLAIDPPLEDINNDKVNNYRRYIESDDTNFSSPATREEVQRMIDTCNTSADDLFSLISMQHKNGKSDIRVEQLKAIIITPSLQNVQKSNEKYYQSYIEGPDTYISSPATVDEVQTMIDEVNSLNLPEHAILDRNFYKRTNGVFEHRFVYLAVTNPKTGRTWLNNNLGADYANVDSRAYSPSQQATTSNDYRAYGSLFEWGRKADGHELIDWNEDGTTGEPLYGTTTTKADEPSNSLWIISDFSLLYDWRVHRDDTLWASESSPNNVCPVGYRLPLNPNGASDGKNEWFVEMSTWDAPDANGSISSYLKLPYAGDRYFSSGQMRDAAEYGEYWTGSDYRSQAYNIYFGKRLDYNDYNSRSDGLSVRCIKDQTPAERSDSILKKIGNEHQDHNSTITVAQLKAISLLNNIEDGNEKWYQNYIENADTHFSSPATLDELQNMIDEVNALNLPDNAILDRNFYKKTNGKFEHRFVYFPVTNSNTGRTWLNNNLGADYANLNSSDYNPSQQATTSNDHLAYGSLFQWGREADGHELFDWTGATAGTAKHGDTDVTNDNPSDSLFIKQRNWRVTPNDTLWASESSANSVCPVGYRLPLNPNGAVDAENELVVELNSWDSKDADGSMLSDLKLPMAGGRKTNGDRAWTASYGIYWSGSVVPSDGNNSTVSNARDIYFGRALGLLDTSARGYGLSVRCIKEQTPAERSASTLLEIGNEHNSHKSTVTVAQLKAITPALSDIKNSYENIYRNYIEGDTHFSSPATRDEVQQMITEVKNLNLLTNAILDRSFFKKTNGVFEHRFVYSPVTNPNTGRTWLNNNLGADYANLNSSDYNPSQQATASNDHLAYGSLFQWGRKADGHELINWTGNRHGIKKYGHTQTKSNDPSNSLYIIGSNDWRVYSNDTLWASKSSKNSVCPVGYRLPLDPNGANDGENEWYQETQTWSSKDPSGAINSVLKLPMSGYSHYWSNDDIVETGNEASYWFGSANGSKAKSMDFYPNNVYSNANSVKAYGFNVRCIKEQTPAEKKTSSTLAQIGREHNSAKSTITIAQLKAITPALKNINDNYENIYQEYIASADSSFSATATRKQVQRMIDAFLLSKLGSYDTAGHSLGHTLSSDGTKAYIANDHGLVIVDTSDPYNPTKLGSYDKAGWSSGVALSSDGTKAYVTNGHGLVIVDISDPAHPTKLGSYDTAGWSYNVTLSSDGTKAYVADEENGLVIVDITDPAHPTKLGSYDTAGWSAGVALSSDGTKAYVADFMNGLVIVDISDSAHPTKLGSYDTARESHGVTLSSDGTRAYITDGTNGLVIVDISDPAYPTKLASYDTAGYALDVTLSSDGTKAYVADFMNGLVIVDISDSAHPTKFSSYDTTGKSYGVTLSSDDTKAYIADGKNGLVIIGGIK